MDVFFKCSDLLSYSKNAERRRRETALQEFAPYFALLKKILASFEKYMDVFFKRMGLFFRCQL